MHASEATKITKEARENLVEWDRIEALIRAAASQGETLLDLDCTRSSQKNS